MNNEYYLRNGKVVGTYEQAATNDEGSETFTLTTNNIPRHNHDFEGTTATGQIIFHNSEFSTINTTSGVFTHETNQNKYNTQLEIYSESGKCTIQNINFSHKPAGGISYVGKKMWHLNLFKLFNNVFS